MKPIQYRDFKIAFHTKQGKAYSLVVDTPAGKGRSTLRLDLSQFQNSWVELGEVVRRGWAGTPVPDIPLTPIEQAGDRLFCALFNGKVKELWDKSWGQMDGQAMTFVGTPGLRLKLEIDPDVPALAQVMSLPWEFLYNKEDRRFLNLDPSTPIVRYLNVPHLLQPYAFQPPLRVLVVISRATSDAGKFAPLDVDTERRLIENAWARAKNVQVDFLSSATLTALRPALHDRDYHVLHFMGHGDFDVKEGKGVLLFEDEDGDPYPIDGRDLAVQLIGEQSLRLVFLNACETARMSAAPGQDPFAGTAAALVMSGIPAVVAMQYPISDTAAITFAKHFYSNLAEGVPVDQATAEGRLAVRGKLPHQMEWGTPVLFMRTDDGRLFPLTDSRAGEPEDFGLPLTMVAGIRNCFQLARLNVLAALPANQHTQAERWLVSLETDVLRLKSRQDFARIRSDLAQFQNWPKALAVIFEVLQEPLLQSRVELISETLLKDYQSLAFEGEE